MAGKPRTAAQMAALKKAQEASARKRRGTGKSKTATTKTKWAVTPREAGDSRKTRVGGRIWAKNEMGQPLTAKEKATAARARKIPGKKLSMLEGTVKVPKGTRVPGIRGRAARNAEKKRKKR